MRKNIRNGKYIPDFYDGADYFNVLFNRRISVVLRNRDYYSEIVVIQCKTLVSSSHIFHMCNIYKMLQKIEEKTNKKKKNTYLVKYDNSSLNFTVNVFQEIYVDRQILKMNQRKKIKTNKHKILELKILLNYFKVKKSITDMSL